MANDVTGVPLIVDTAASTTLTDYTFTVTKIRWVNATTAGHTAIVQNKNSKVKFSAVATAANYTESEHFDPPLILEGLIVPTLGSGTLYIYQSSATPIRT